MFALSTCNLSQKVERQDSSTLEMKIKHYKSPNWIGLDTSLDNADSWLTEGRIIKVLLYLSLPRGHISRYSNVETRNKFPLNFIWSGH